MALILFLVTLGELYYRFMMKFLRKKELSIYWYGMSKRRCMRPSVEPLEACWKPLLLYMAAETLRQLAWGLLRWNGFILCTEGSLTYWYHPGAHGSGSSRSPPSPAQSKPSSVPRPLPLPASRPVVFVHGLGGLYGYVPLLLRLRARRPMSAQIVPILHHCSLFMPPYAPPPPVDTAALIDGLIAAVRAHSSMASMGCLRRLSMAWWYIAESCR